MKLMSALDAQATYAMSCKDVGENKLTAYFNKSCTKQQFL